MDHPDEGRLRALVDRELVDADASEVRAHVGVCGECDATVRRMEETQLLATALLDALDGPPPTERVRARIAERRGEMERARQARRFGFGRRELTRAALMVLGFSGAVAAAVHPASPMRKLFAPEPQALVIAPTVEPTSTVAASVAPAREVGVRLAVPPGGMRVALAGVAPGSSVQLAWVEDEAASVYAPEGTSFTTAEALGRIEAQMTGAGTVRIELPREIARASLTVNGSSYLEKTGERIDFPGAPALVDGPRVSFEVR